nr:DUF4245 domain-containing protein [Rhizohabitans arisaemae]
MRFAQGFSGYIVAMLVCLAAVAVFLVITPQRDTQHIPKIDYQPAVWELRRQAPYPVHVPEGLPAGWIPTSSRVETTEIETKSVKGVEHETETVTVDTITTEPDPAEGSETASPDAEAGSEDGAKGEAVTWRLGFTTPLLEHAMLAQSNEDPTEFANRMANSDKPVGTQQVGSVTWEQRFREDKKQRTLILKRPGVTLVVTGTAGWEELGRLAVSLRAETPVTPTPVPSAS